VFGARKAPVAFGTGAIPKQSQSGTRKGTMTKRVLDYDPLTGMTTHFDYIPETDTTVISREQDVSTILDINKALQNNEQITKDGIKEGWWQYAKIPMIVIEKWINEHGVDVFNKDHQKAVFRLLNQPEYRYLKTTTKMHRG
jgi:hypothetical protein